MIEAYCSTCDTLTQQEEMTLFYVLLVGRCTICQHANPLKDSIPLVLSPILGSEFRAYQEKKRNGSKEKSVDTTQVQHSLICQKSCLLPL